MVADSLYAEHMAFRSQLCQVSYQFKDMGIRTFPVDGKVASIRWADQRWSRFTDRKIHNWYDPNPPGRRDVVPMTGVAAIPGWMSGGLAVRDFDRIEAARAWMEARPGCRR